MTPENEEFFSVDGSGLETRPHGEKDAEQRTGRGAYVTSKLLRGTAEHGNLILEHSAGLTAENGAVLRRVGPRLVFRGGLTAVNAALAQVRYMPSPDWVGDVVVWVRANDYGFSGVGGAMQSVAQVHLRVSPVNDAPTILWQSAALHKDDRVLKWTRILIFILMLQCKMCT